MLATVVFEHGGSYGRYEMEASIQTRDASDAGLPTHGGRGFLRSAWRRSWMLVTPTGAALLGLAPHLLHHAGPLAGAALFAGAAGSLFFGALGLLTAIPLLLRLRRRFGSWRVPGAALATFAAVFLISTLVIGPAVTGADSTSNSTAAPPSVKGSGHELHH